MAGETVGMRLRQLRKDRGWSLRQTAAALGVDFTYLSKIEHDHNRPGVALIRRIASKYGVGPDELLTLADRLPTREQLLSQVAAARREGWDAALAAVRAEVEELPSYRLALDWLGPGGDVYEVLARLAAEGPKP